MKSKAGFSLALSSLFLFSACATFSSGCRTLMHSDAPIYYLKIFSNGNIVDVEESARQSFEPAGVENLSAPPTHISNNGPLYPFDLVVDQPKKCGGKIDQNVRLAFRGNIVFNGPFETEPGKWKVLYRDPSQDLKIMVKVVGKQ